MKFNDFDYYDQRLETEAHKIGKRNKQINHLLFFLQRAEAIRIANEGGFH